MPGTEYTTRLARTSSGGGVFGGGLAWPAAATARIAMPDQFMSGAPVDVRAQVLEARVGEEGHHRGRRPEALRHSDGGGHVCAGRRPPEQRLLPGEAPGHVLRVR